MALETIQQIALGGGGVILILMTLLQITPIKINPWSWIARSIGRAINHDVINKVDKLGEDVSTLRKECDEREVTLCRTHILRFGDEILHGVLHSKEHYLQILADIDTYEAYCSTHIDYKNNVAGETIKHIKHKYQEHLEEDSFLWVK